MEVSNTILSVLVGITLSCAVGFKVIIPAFIVSLLAYCGYLQLNDSFDWFANIYVVIGLSIAFVYEIISTCIPGLGAMQKTIGMFIAPIIGFCISVAILPSEVSNFVSWVVGFTSGATGLGVAFASTTIRGTADTLSFGISAPVTGGVEIASASAISGVASILTILPTWVAVLLFIIFITVFILTIFLIIMFPIKSVTYCKNCVIRPLEKLIFKKGFNKDCVENI